MTENKRNMPQRKINSTVDDDKNTNLHFVAARGDAEKVLKEIEDGHKIDPVNFLGWTPLMMATRNGHLDVVKIFLEHKADATRKNKFGASIFLMAVTTGNLNVIRVILQHLLCGGVSRQSMEANFSPISFAVLFGHEHIAQYLLDKSFGIDCKTPRTGITPLMFAAAKENLKLSLFLGIRGASENVKNINKQSAKDISLVKRRKAQSRRLRQMQQQYGQSPTPPVVFVSPQPCMPLPQIHMQRKSSDLMSPSYFFPPNFTPISPVSFVPQVFFPPDFGTSPYLTPMHHYYCPNEMLNARINQSTFMSPMAPNFSPLIHSPCPNAPYQ